MIRIGNVLLPLGKGDGGDDPRADVFGGLVGICVYQADRVISTGGGEGASVRGERHRLDAFGVTGENGRGSGVVRVGDVPQSRCAVKAGTC